MDISALTGVSTDFWGNSTAKGSTDKTSETSFDNILNAAMNMIQETNAYENAAESAEIQFALGESVNTHDLQVAQEKANIALQFTVSVRDGVLEAYNTIMNMQI
ncbi:MAG: flagellar hook-basal body complex protein FliE [Roseburia sp.]